MRALVIEDDAALREQLVRFLSEEGFAVDTASDGSQGAFIAEEYPADVAIIDLGLPQLPGIEIVRRARARGRVFPILILTARDGWQAKVEALQAGADDYLVKPFHREELIARLRALLRRSGGWASAQLVSGPYVVDTSARTVSRDGQPAELTDFEFRVLEYLLTHAGKAISKAELTEHLYTEDEERDSNVIEVFIRRLRSKLDPDSRHTPITTIRGAGYRWDLPRG
ncbi:response regulator transcription factor [Sinimarinibacterium sp. NLF-5-8]|uniref:response regulator transcription factor n=1 Tax=Sinimarinibacterium sp. NLF-5-8 TaxID=2698684 RepID=UPI00137BB44B|nr:response regulator transcription factor [Sinimarinibacterium sp. NLF-5-8]QHS09703.1 response regulator transcription factor [Sinimarinibacterium sp. NLF-5-8]